MRITVLFITLFNLFNGSVIFSQSITTGTLLNEMIDLQRLTYFNEPVYKTIQFSSYDRRSTSVSDPGWLANNDGGNSPIPGFEEVVREPDENGIATYLICDIKEPGVIVRLWSAGIKGSIRMFLDGNNTPVYEGMAENFFWNFIEEVSPVPGNYNIFRQFDAVYFPIPFAKSCRIEWTGNIKTDGHFYHVGVRVYKSDVNLETFQPGDFAKYAENIEKVNIILSDPDNNREYNDSQINTIETVIPANANKELAKLEGTKAIEYFSIKMTPQDHDILLRKTVLNVYFDNSSVPQIQSPIGDFFGAAPGINPYKSLPFTVLPDGTMICRFIMPFKKSARIEIVNNSMHDINLTADIRITDYVWKDDESMHFRARWRINHNVLTTPVDIPYLLASGRGRVAGAAIFLYNPCNIPTGFGNWWGEGDEKIFVDEDTFPSFFGTGSEDYFNYSWGSSKIFSYPYCGQPRNDGPGSRGFVTNFRWHILDDIPFNNKLAFYMELLHHDYSVQGFSYGRIIYLYSRPDLIDDHMEISPDDIREITLPLWKPEARIGAKDFYFIEAEKLLKKGKNVTIEECSICSENKMVMWQPKKKGEKINFLLQQIDTSKTDGFALTLLHVPQGGKFSLFVNGSLVKLSSSEWCVSESCYFEERDLHIPYQTILQSYHTGKIMLNIGKNEIVLEYLGEGNNNKIGIDFLWIKN